MKHLFYRHFCLTAIALIVCTFVVNGQETYKLAEGSRIWVDGTSTLRDWKAEVGTFTGTITTDAAGQVADISLTMDVMTMDGGRGPDMNAKIYKALLADQFPQMTFKGKKANPEGGDLGTQGTLSLAGVNKTIMVSAQGNVASGHLSGQYKLKFSEYNIEPPSALFGTIVCHDDLVVMFDLNLSK
ncbi:MAG: YceI family protein [Saprospiraceae bacterium]|nr:YceI family protein [Saprospiraceae bacterium]